MQTRLSEKRGRDEDFKTVQIGEGGLFRKQKFCGLRWRGENDGYCRVVIFLCTVLT